MSKQPVVVAVVTDKGVIEKVLIDGRANVQLPRLRAIAGAKYIISVNTDEEPPVKLSIIRQGDDLVIAPEGENAAVIIENYFNAPGPLISTAPDHSEVVYHPAASGTNIAQLENGEEMVLQPVAAGDSASVTIAGDSGSLWPWLAGAGALGVAGGAWALVHANKGKGEKEMDDDEPGPLPPPLPDARPEITRIVDNEGSKIGDIHAGDASDDQTPDIYGKASANAIVNIYDGEKLLGSAQADGEGNWHFILPTLDPGSHSLQVSEVTSTGESAKSAPIAFEVDLTPPAPGVPDGDGGDGSVTNNSRPAFTGSAEPGSRMFIEYTRTGSLTPIVVEVQLDADGNWRWSPDAALADGIWSFRTYAIDAAGNRSDYSAPWSIEVDTAPPPPPQSFQLEHKTLTVTFDASTVVAGDHLLIYAEGLWREHVLTEDDILSGKVVIPDLSSGLVNLSVGIIDQAGNCSDHITNVPKSREYFSGFESGIYTWVDWPANRQFTVRESYEAMIGEDGSGNKFLTLSNNVDSQFSISDVYSANSAKGIHFDYYSEQSFTARLKITDMRGVSYFYNIDVTASKGGWQSFYAEFPSLFGIQYFEFTIVDDDSAVLNVDNIGFTGGDFGGDQQNVPAPEPQPDTSINASAHEDKMSLPSLSAMLVNDEEMFLTEGINELSERVQDMIVPIELPETPWSGVDEPLPDDQLTHIQHLVTSDSEQALRQVTTVYID